MTGRVVYSTKLTGEIHVPQLEDYTCLALKIAAICSSPTVLADVKLTDRIDGVLNDITRMGGTVSARTGKIKIEPAQDLEAVFLALFDEDLNEIEAALSAAKQETKETEELPAQNEATEDEATEDETAEDEAATDLFRDGDYYFRNAISDNALIALLIGSVFYSNKVSVMLGKPPANTEYIDLALNLISSFGGMAESTDYLTFSCSGVRKLIGGGVLSPEGDWNIAAFGLMCSALGFSVNIRGSHGSFSVQHGAEILSPMKRMGFTLEKSFDGRLRYVTGPDMFPTNVDAHECADFLPYMILMGALCEGKTEIFHIDEALPKEVSDRIVYTVTELSKLGVDFFSEKEDAFTVTGQKSFEGGIKLDCHNDFVLATTLILATLRCRKPNTLLNLDVVEARYPDFWRLYESIGGFSEEIG